MPSQAIQFTPAWPHGDIEPVFPDVFLVTGTNKVQHEGANIQTSRNMTIIRNVRFIGTNIPMRSYGY
ncbi:MAG: hypothetical protein K0R76_565 [Alphaproteobacteria bacterium]|nr:hypothetical protein [Alphaproteobacteria bacterium]